LLPHLAFAREPLETTSPREWAVLVRERARRTIHVEEGEAHGLTCALLDGARALEVVEDRRGEARARSEGQSLVESN
jgi:hypothetical protein